MKKLIFIDDDPIDHFLMKHLLGEKNYTNNTTFTMNGELVLDYIEENKLHPQKLPDVIFLDLKMPVFSGWDFLDRMKLLHPQIAKNIKVYVMSSSVRLKDKERSSRYGFVSSFISKPIKQLEIEQIVEGDY